ncbi:hypothetical protein QBC34DRAFT_346210 [Podospora aff. communis PSN243]|uniref:PIG-P domain-containing protein n=1 Tax=Podospora aff. communis PSN243 TaxID=3040156 RepID=A0AAV9GVT5_9PEZI|nr:hypothetical protein QBC34DRAFT_346210 [Podospora aff. communis PSN243]
MDQIPSLSSAAAAEAQDLGTGVARPLAPTRKRSTSGGLLSKFSFIRPPGDSGRPRSRRSAEDADPVTSGPNSLPVPSFRTIPATDTAAPPPLSHAILQQTQQQKTRRRRGSLRKVALLGRGAQRERREDRGLTIDTKFLADNSAGQQGRPDLVGAGGITVSPTPLNGTATGPNGGVGSVGLKGNETYGLGISDITPRPSMEGYTRSTSSDGGPSPRPSRPLTTPTATTMRSPQDATDSTLTSPSISYSTTDDEDGLHMAGPVPRPTTPSLSLSSSSISLLRPERASLSSGSESYFPGHSHPRTLGSTTPPSIQHRRTTIQRAKSPLALTSLAGLSTTPLPAPEGDWDYAETEWWGWVVLIVTWTVFVVGMGSCLGVWSWAWDVGTTPYAPPELEDDPTLPIVGYYPALMILTGVMAWVWVVVAWIGMKYFRHARVSGD